MSTRRHPDAWRHPSARRPTDQIVPAVLLGLVVALGLGGVAGAAGKAASVLDTPRVGDMATFRPQPGADGEIAPIVSAMRAGPNGTACTLDEAAMAGAQGSLLVVGRLAGPDGRFLVHWAGRGNSATKQGCGTSTDLLLNRADLQALLDAGWNGAGYRNMSVTEAMAAYPAAG